MMEHLRNYIGLYLTVLVLPFMFGYGVSEEHPTWVWWIAFIIIIWKTPPYNIGDHFWGAYTRLLEWLLGPFINWIKSWPMWARTAFAILVLITTEEYILKPLGYTIYPWRMDFSL